jgi:hypothetical protein
MASTVKPGSDGRQAGGRFGPGNSISRGNPHARRMHELRGALLADADPDAVRRVGRKLLALAENGDVAAIKIWLSYVIGQPVQAVELTGPDGGPLGVDFVRLEGAVLAALEPFGAEARFAVAGAIRGVSVGRDDAAIDQA